MTKSTFYKDVDNNIIIWYYYNTDTGFYYLQTRYYDPVIRRFINADSVVSNVGGDILGYNQYASFWIAHLKLSSEGVVFWN